MWFGQALAQTEATPKLSWSDVDKISLPYKWKCFFFTKVKYECGFQFCATAHVLENGQVTHQITEELICSRASWEWSLFCWCLPTARHLFLWMVLLCWFAGSRQRVVQPQLRKSRLVQWQGVWGSSHALSILPSPSYFACRKATRKVQTSKQGWSICHFWNHSRRRSSVCDGPDIRGFEVTKGAAAQEDALKFVTLREDPFCQFLFFQFRFLGSAWSAPSF